MKYIFSVLLVVAISANASNVLTLRAAASNVIDYCSDVSTYGALAQVGKCDDNDAGFMLSYEYRFSNGFSLEMAYHDAGAAEISVAVDSATFAARLPFESLELAGKTSVEISSDFSFFGRIGLAYHEYQLETPDDTINIEVEDVSPVYGIGVEYRSLVMGLDVIQNAGREINKGDFQRVYLGMVLKF